MEGTMLFVRLVIVCVPLLLVDSFLIPCRIAKENPQQYTDRIGWSVVNQWPPPITSSCTTTYTSIGSNSNKDVWSLSSSRRNVESSSTSSGSRSNKRVSEKSNRKTIKATASLGSSSKPLSSSSSSSSGARLNYRPFDNDYVVESPQPFVATVEDRQYISTRTSDHRIDNISEDVSLNDPRMIEFVSTSEGSVILPASTGVGTFKGRSVQDERNVDDSVFYPFAKMMSACAPYIAGHAGKIAVFHIPGLIIENESIADRLLSDMALCWLMGMKIVIVAGSRHLSGDGEDTCQIPSDDYDENYNKDHTVLHHSHECHNALRVTSSDTIRHIEEEASFIRTEIERKLNRCLRAHGSCSTFKSSDEEGNIVSGNFYTAQKFGIVRDIDYQHTGYTSAVNTESIYKVLANNDVVLLSSVGLSPFGDLVNVNGYHLAATVAAKLYATKLIFIANTDSSVLRRVGETTSIQEIPISLSKDIINYHKVKCHNTGFATFEHARNTLQPGDVELLLNFGWCNWALDRGVGRAHIINPEADGSLLEELYTSNYGANTCIYHDSDMQQRTDGMVATEDWDEFFNSQTD
jgi:acetylglutamate kinase